MVYSDDPMYDAGSRANVPGTFDLNAFLAKLGIAGIDPMRDPGMSSNPTGGPLTPQAPTPTTSAPPASTPTTVTDAQARQAKLRVLDDLAKQLQIGLAVNADTKLAPAQSISYPSRGNPGLQQNTPLFANDFYGMLMAGAKNALGHRLPGGS